MLILFVHAAKALRGIKCSVENLFEREGKIFALNSALWRLHRNTLDVYIGDFV
jgi:hypothetical protein